MHKRKFQADAHEAARSVDSIGTAAERADAKIDSLNSRALLFRNVLGLVKPLALVTGLGLAAQGASALGAGIVALTAALAPLSGAMVVYPGLGLAAAQGFGVWKLATSGLADAVGGLHEKMDPKKLALLTTAGQNLAVEMDKAKAPVLALQRAAQAGLFPGLAAALGIIRPLLGGFQSEMKATGAAMGAVSLRFAYFARAAGPDLQTLMQRNATYIYRMGVAGVELTNALRHVLMAAGPFLSWVTRSIMAFGQWTSNAAAAGRQSGKMAAFFAKTRVVMTSLGHTARDLGATFLNIGKGAAPLGADLLRTFERGAAAMRRWSESAKGQGQIAAYFRVMKPPLYELGRLARDVVGAFLRMGNQPGLAKLLSTVRTGLLPAFTKLTMATTAAFGPLFIQGVTTASKLLASLSGATGPTTLLLNGFVRLAQGLTWMVANVPGLRQLAVVMLTVGAAARALPLLLVVTGLKRMALAVRGVVGAYRSLAMGMGAMKAVYIAQTGITNASSLAVLRHMAATKLSAAATKVMSGAQAALNLVMSANPILLVIVGLAALGAAFYLAYTKVEWFRNGVNAVFGFIRAHWPLLVGILTGGMVPAILSIIRHWSGVKSAVSSVVSFVASKFSGLVGTLRGLAGKLSGALRGAWTGLKEGFRSAVNFVIRGWNALHFGMKAKKVAGHTVIPGFEVGTPDIPMLASGGLLRRGSAVVGDAGPELLTLDGSSARVDPLPNVSAFRSPAPTIPDVGGSLADTDGLKLEVRVPVHLDGRVIYEAIGHVARDRVSRK